MIKPANDFILLELYDEHSGIIRSDIAEYGRGDTFIVKAKGSGYFTDSGVRVEIELEVGDRVWLGGQILKLPYGKETVLLGRAGDVLAFEKAAEIGKYEDAGIIQAIK